MKPTQHVTVTGVQADELPVGSVIMPVDPRIGDRPIVWKGDNFELEMDVHYRVLYVPEPVQPRLGDNLSLEQLDALPDTAGVVDEQGDLWQKRDAKWWYQASKHSGPLPSSEQARLGRVTLVRLPPTDGDAS